MYPCERSLRPLSDEELKMTGQLVLRAMKHQQLEDMCTLMSQYGEEGLAFRRLVRFGITGWKSDAEWVPRAAWCEQICFFNKLEIPGAYALVKSTSCKSTFFYFSTNWWLFDNSTLTWEPYNMLKPTKTLWKRHPARHVDLTSGDLSRWNTMVTMSFFFF